MSDVFWLLTGALLGSMISGALMNFFLELEEAAIEDEEKK